jgi:hypothetical protein
MSDDYDDEVPGKARSTDPDTSHFAAATVKVARLEKAIVATLAAHGDLTAKEIAIHSGEEYCSVTPRMPDMILRQLVYNTGRKRCNPRSNKPAMIYSLKPPEPANAQPDLFPYPDPSDIH